MEKEIRVLGGTAKYVLTETEDNKTTLEGQYGERIIIKDGEIIYGRKLEGRIGQKI